MNSAKIGDDIQNRGYADSSVLVSHQWMNDHLSDPKVRIVESNEDPLLYQASHIPGAVELDWARDLNDQITRDYLSADKFAATMTRLGISPDTTVVLYGDRNNWWACFSFWILKLFGHNDVRLMDGGRLLWEQQKLPLVREVPTYSAAYPYPTRVRDDRTIRALRDVVLEHVQRSGKLIDVRSPDEFTGKKLHMDGYPNEGALRGGHIPGAKSVPWSRAVNTETGEFKNAAELKAIYEGEAGLRPGDDVIAYCRIGERSSHTWFVLTYLLGYQKVRNYDGSWTEWGNLVGAPIER
jgi:thiosulfate/3-mercaptopyruvate sulfurtransferase